MRLHRLHRHPLRRHLHLLRSNCDVGQKRESFGFSCKDIRGQVVPADSKAGTIQAAIEPFLLKLKKNDMTPLTVRMCRTTLNEFQKWGAAETLLGQSFHGILEKPRLAGQAARDLIYLERCRSFSKARITEHRYFEASDPDGLRVEIVDAQNLISI